MRCLIAGVIVAALAPMVARPQSDTAAVMVLKEFVAESMPTPQCHASSVIELEGVLLAALAEWHGAHPLVQGAPRRELRRGPLGQLAGRAFDALVGELAASERLVLEGPRVRLPDFHAEPDTAASEKLQMLQAMIQETGLEGAPFDDLVAASGDQLSWLTEKGEQGATATCSMAPWERSCQRSTSRWVSRRMSASFSTTRSGGRPPWLCPTLIEPRVAVKRMPARAAPSMASSSRQPFG